MSRKLIIHIHESTTEIELDDYFDAGEDMDFDALYYGFIHEVITRPDYDWDVEVN